jgi:putative peptide zinc metalloprotease protein
LLPKSGPVSAPRPEPNLGSASPVRFPLTPEAAIDASRAAGEFARASGFSAALADAATGAVEEAAMQVVRRAPPGAPPFSLQLTRERDALLLEVRYSKVIPFNPPELARRVAEGLVTDELEKLDAEVWLRLAKFYVDDVVYVIDGGDRVLRLRLYARQAGQERSLWFIELKPRLAAGIELEEQTDETGRVHALLHDPVGGNVLPLRARDLFVIRRLDGQTSMREIYMAHVGQFGLVSPHELGGLLKRLDELGFLDTERRQNRSGWRERWLAPQFTLPHGEKLVNAVYRLVRPLVSPVGAALLLLVGLSGAIPLVAQWSRIHELLASPFHGLHENAAALPWVYGLLCVVVIIHELGHGVVCRHFGGRVSRLGMEFYVVMFIFYCDVTSSWLFRNKWHRILVALGGPLTTFAVIGACLWGFDFLAPNYPQAAFVCYAGALLCSVELVVNLNPFLRMDAYFVLMDWTEMPDLRRRAFRYLASLLPGLRDYAPARAPSGREKVLLVAYGIAGSLMTAAFFVSTLIHYLHQLSEEAGVDPHAYLVAVIVAVLLFHVFGVVSRAARRLRHREISL